jgi:hypothetical protein
VSLDRHAAATLLVALPALVAFAVGCEPGAAPGSAPSAAAQATVRALPDSTFASLVARISEPGGYFDTDNLLSNERGYLKVMGALDRIGVRGGAYVGVGPDQNFSYIARIRPDIAFIVDIRRDNLLHHLLLRALVTRAPTRAGFLAGLFGREPPPDPSAWRDRPVEDVLAFVETAPSDSSRVAALDAEVARAVASFGVPLTDAELATIRRFHHTFIRAGPALRFTSYGRAPRPYYPTYRQLLIETDVDGRQASWLADAASYTFVREMERAGRIVPVVGDLGGGHAVREIGNVLSEMKIPLSAFYVSNVEFYLVQQGTIDAWIANLATLPATPEALVIRSVFPNYRRDHPSAVPGYYAAQTLQPVATLVSGGFRDYWDLVTRDVLPLR